MQPNHEPDELSEVLEAGYAAPPLDAAFSDNLVRRMQAEVVPQSSLPQSRHTHRAIVLCGVGVAASILAVIYAWNPLETKASRDEIAMQAVPDSSVELSTSLESKSTKSLETESIPTSDAKASDTMLLDVPLAKSRGGEAARGTSSFESKLESRKEVPRGIVANKVSEPKKSLSTLSESESMSAAVTEEFEIVTKDRAKALGLAITFQADGPDAVRVSLEFEKQAELRDYNRVELKQFDGDKRLLSLTLKEGESKPGRIIVGFEAAPSNLATVSLEIVAKDRGTRVRYVLPMKDFATKPEGLTQQESYMSVSRRKNDCVGLPGLGISFHDHRGLRPRQRMCQPFGLRTEEPCGLTLQSNNISLSTHQLGNTDDANPNATHDHLIVYLRLAAICGLRSDRSRNLARELAQGVGTVAQTISHV